MDPERSQTIELAALGRPFSLGMLYDCRRDSLIPGLTLWDYEDLEKDTRKRSHKNNEFEIVASETIDDKTSSLNVEASLKASFLGGLVDVSGSAKYLKDSKTSQNQARVTLKYKATTGFQELSMNTLGRGNVKHPHVFDSGIATHVVTGILYGAQAFFVFDRDVSHEENREEIEGNLKVVINKIPCLAIDGQGSLQMKDTDNANSDKFSCKFYGDFSLKKNPVSFKDAIEAYQSLPELLSNGENAVPVKVWLMPLQVLDSTAAQLVRQISNGLVNEAQHVLEDLSELELRCNDAIKSPVSQQFPQISKKLRAFKDKCNEYKLEFQKILAKKLPSIRGGGEEESVLAEVLKISLSSPFNNKDLSEWMRSKEREINIIKSLTAMMKNTKIVSSHNELDQIILSPETEHVVCFAFTSLQMAEPYLSTLSTYLRETSKQVNTEDTALHIHDVEKEQWYFSKDVYQSLRQKAKLIIDFSEANKENKNIHFLTTAIPNESQKGASIYLYKDGFEVNDNFEPPSKPEKTEATDITHNSVTLKMHPPGFGAEDISHYSIEYCVTGQDGWQQQTASKADDVTVSNLTPNTEYTFRYRAVCPVGRGPASEVSMKTLPTSPPGKPQVEAYSDQLSVNWEKPTELGDGVTVESYSVEYVKVSTGMKHEQLQWNKVTSTAEKALISGLEPMTAYAVRIRCECGVAGRSKESITVPVQTCQRLAEFYRPKCTLINSGSPSVYKVPLEINKINIDGCKNYSFGKESKRQHRTIMVLGEIGAGKTTLINGMINYILGVQWEDSSRFTLIDEDQTTAQAESQTSEVTVYKINHQEGFQIDYSLTIVDTPGFGDTRGIDRNRLIIEKLNKLFTAECGVSDIDAVCLVAQASARLTPSQKFVFDSVLSIFGKDIAENIRVLVTFADCQAPPVLEAIKVAGVPCPETNKGMPLHFKFNNSALFAANKSCGANNAGASGDEDDEDGSFDKMFWAMGFKSMKNFFKALNQMSTKTLTLTKEVLKERKKLENSIENLQKQVTLGLVKLDEIKQTAQILETHKSEMAANKNFEFEVTIKKPNQIAKDGFNTNCQQCSTTCHYPCPYPNDKDKMKCIVMGSDGYCTVCPNKCIWSVHFNQKYIWEYKDVKEKRTVKELQEKYQRASKKKMSVEDMFTKLRFEYDDLQMQVVKLIEMSGKCLNRLKYIALRPNPRSTPEYIDLLIEGEKAECKPGYMDRIKSLKEMRGKAVYMAKLEKGETLFSAKI